MSPAVGGRASGVELARKAAITAVLGGLTFIVSYLLDGPLGISRSDQLILSVIVGSVTLLTQFLIDFEQRLGGLEDSQTSNLDEARRVLEQRLRGLEDRQTANILEARKVIDTGFARINDATRLFALVEASALQTDALTQLVHRAGRINGTSAELVRELAHYEIDRVSSLLKSLSDGNEVFYDGEDRDWMLGLTTNVQSSISATSLATVDAGVTSFEGGLWMTDLGGRYLDMQRAATERGVRIRRIFVFDEAPALDRSDFLRIYRLHRTAGVEVRVLDSSSAPQHLKNLIFDFILFDQVISYETTPATRMDATGKPSIVTTRLVLDTERVRNRGHRFERLWEVAQPAEELPSSG